MTDKDLLKYYHNIDFVDKQKIMRMFRCCFCLVLLILGIINKMLWKSDELNNILMALFFGNILYFIMDNILTAINFMKFYKVIKNETIIPQQEKNDRKD